MPALQTFCIQAAVAIIFNYMFLITAFVVAFIADAERRKAGRMDVFFCIKKGEEAAPRDFWKKKFGGGYNSLLKKKPCGFAVLGISLVLLGLGIVGLM